MKEMILTDESLNSYGTWVVTDGIDMERFNKNPIMLYNHHRTYNGKTDEMLPIGRWENVHVENGVMKATPVFDEKDEFAVKIKNKVENGFITGVSIGIRVVSYSDEPSLLKPEQKSMTITKCILMEASIVDIPSNPNATIVLYDENHNVLNLSDGNAGGFFDKLKLNNNNTMKEIALKLGLKESATEKECVSAVELKDNEITTLKAELKGFKDKELSDRKQEAASLIDNAVKTGRIDAKAKADFEKLFEDNFDSAKSALSAIPERQSLVGKINNSTESKFEKMSWDELDRADLLAELKEKDPNLYQNKFNEKFKKK